MVGTRFQYFERPVLAGATKHTLVFREASTGGYQAYSGISRGRYRGVPSVPRDCERLVPGGTGRSAVFREAGAGGRTLVLHEAGRYREVPGVPRYFKRPIPRGTRYH